MEMLGHGYKVLEKTGYSCGVSESIWENPSHPSHGWSAGAGNAIRQDKSQQLRRQVAHQDQFALNTGAVLVDQLKTPDGKHALPVEGPGEELHHSSLVGGAHFPGQAEKFLGCEPFERL